MDPVELPVDQIPGIGIIRARALKKAGWPTVGSLRDAGLQDLLSVPGLTEIKAAQILQYVQDSHQAPPSSRRRAKRDAPRLVVVLQAEAEPVLAQPEEIPITFDEPTPDEQEVAVYAIETPADLMQEIAMTAQRLLTCDLAARWERPFAAQLGKLMSLYEKWDQYEPLGKKRSKQIMELLQKIHRLLTETPEAELTKRKSQEQFAELLRDRRRRLRDLLKG
jgi:hypothetical protein